jgi:hypothetical protein
MRVTLDEQPCAIDAESIGDAIGSAAALAEERGRVIVEVIVDGNSWDQDQLGSSELRAGRADHLDLVTADLGELVHETLRDAAAALDDADRLQREAAELLQSDQAQIAMVRLGEAFGIWQSVQQAVAICGDALQVDLTALKVADNPLQQSVVRLDEQLQSLRTALENKDMVSLADMLLYELPEVVAEWREVLDTLQQCGETT